MLKKRQKDNNNKRIRKIKQTKIIKWKPQGAITPSRPNDIDRASCKDESIGWLGLQMARGYCLSVQIGFPSSDTTVLPPNRSARVVRSWMSSSPFTCHSCLIPRGHQINVTVWDTGKETYSNSRPKCTPILNSYTSLRCKYSTFHQAPTICLNFN